MQRDCTLRISGRRRLTSFSVEYKTERPRQTSRREDRHIVRNARVQPSASSAAIQAQVAPSLGAPVSSQTIRRRLAKGHLGSRLPLRELTLTPTHQCLRLDSDDNRVRVWRPRGECLNPAFALQRHTAPTASPARSPDLSPIEHIWDRLGQRVGHPMSLNELEARLQHIWNEISQDIIQNLYASMPNRIASCIRARGGSTGY
ncbi:transposable element Tcb2 transposase [Trichonephila clavipes]|nr:transposable element Tcb2 transposase [Trichonephila clavipes]